jgi:hypothetical protein
MGLCAVLVYGTLPFIGITLIEGKMLKFLRCLFIGHDWSILSITSHKHLLATLKGEWPDNDIKRGLLGWKEWTHQCKKCSKIVVKQTIGE